MTDAAEFFVVILDGKRIVIQAKVLERWLQFHPNWPLVCVPLVDPDEEAE